ncbi:MAG: DUF5615 family PIN-like protein [Phototrophicaceae bacterium]
MRFATDENFDGRMLAGLQRRIPDLDVVRVQDTIMYQAPDHQLLEWLAEENRILITHDVKTMPRYLYQRVEDGLVVPGVIEVNDNLPIGKAIDDLELLIMTSRPTEFENQVRYVPLPEISG